MRQPPFATPPGSLPGRCYEKGKWSLGLKIAPLQAAGFQLEAFLRAPAGWDLSGPRRIREWRAPPCGLNDAPAAIRETLRTNLLCSEEFVAYDGLKIHVSSFGPRFFRFRRSVGAAGALATHIGDDPGLRRTGHLIEGAQISGAPLLGA